MLDFSTAQTEIDRLIALFPRAPRVFLVESVRKLDHIPDYLVERIKVSAGYIEQVEGGNLLVNGIYYDDTPVNLASSAKNLHETDGYVVLFLENIEELPRLQEAFMHEVLGHYAVTRSMAQRMRDSHYADRYLKRDISEYNLFHDYILSENRKHAMRKMYEIPSSFLARFKHSTRIRGFSGKSKNPLMSAITAHLLKNDFDSLIASEIIAHSVNHYLKDNSIEDAINLLGHCDDEHEASIWNYTRGNMSLLKRIDLRKEEQVNRLIFSWMIGPAMDWLMTPDFLFKPEYHR